MVCVEPHGQTLGNCQELQSLRFYLLASQQVSPPVFWMLAEDMRLLDQSHSSLLGYEAARASRVSLSPFPSQE